MTEKTLQFGKESQAEFWTSRILTGIRESLDRQDQMFGGTWARLMLSTATVQRLTPTLSADLLLTKLEIQEFLSGLIHSLKRIPNPWWKLVSRAYLMCKLKSILITEESIGQRWFSIIKLVAWRQFISLFTISMKRILLLECSRVPKHWTRWLISKIWKFMFIALLEWVEHPPVFSHIFAFSRGSNVGLTQQLSTSMSKLRERSLLQICVLSITRSIKTSGSKISKSLTLRVRCNS